MPRWPGRWRIRRPATACCRPKPRRWAAAARSSAASCAEIPQNTHGSRRSWASGSIRRGRTGAGLMGPDRRHLITGALALGLAGAMPARAQSAYPNRPVRVIVPVAPGGLTDVVARVISGKVSEQLGEEVVVVKNVAGARNVARCE